MRAWVEEASISALEQHHENPKYKHCLGRNTNRLGIYYLGKTYVKVYSQKHWDYTTESEAPKLSDRFISAFWMLTAENSLRLVSMRLLFWN